MPLHLTSNEHEIVTQTLSKLLPASAKIYAFGSRVREICKPFSDLDLAVDLGRALSETELLNLKDAFDESALIFKVDIVDLHSLSDSFKSAIEPELVLL